MLFIIPILLFAILCLCLPQLMIMTIIGAFVYFICRALSKRNMSKMIIVIVVFSCLSTVMEKVLPLVEEEQKKQQYVEDKINDVKKYVDPTSKLYDKENVQKPIDKIIDDNLPDNSFLRKLTEYPRTRWEYANYHSQ